MEIESIIQKLQDSGFVVEVSGMTILVSLNRNIDTMEVWTALDYTSAKYSKIGKYVAIDF